MSRCERELLLLPPLELPKTRKRQGLRAVHFLVRRDFYHAETFSIDLHPLLLSISLPIYSLATSLCLSIVREIEGRVDSFHVSAARAWVRAGSLVGRSKHP